MFDTTAVQWSSNYLNANSINIHYWQSVQCSSSSAVLPALPILIFVHGLFLSGATWIYPTAPFAKNFTVVLPDLRGHGWTQPIPKGSLTMENLMADLKAVIDHMSPDGPVLLAGHSFGASVVARMTVRWPELVAGILLEEPPWNRPPGEPYALSGYLNFTTGQINATFIIAYSDLLKNMTEGEFDITDAAGRPHLPLPGEDDARATRQFDTSDITDDDVMTADVWVTEAVYGLRLPVVLQIGDLATSSTASGSRLNPAVAQKVQATYPRSELSCFANASHWIHIPPTKVPWTERTLSYFLSFPRNGSRVASGDVLGAGSNASCTLPSWTFTGGRTS